MVSLSKSALVFFFISTIAGNLVCCLTSMPVVAYNAYNGSSFLSTFSCKIFSLELHALHSNSLGKGAFKYYISAFGGEGGLRQNADIADALEGGGESNPKLQYADTLKGRVGGELKLRASIVVKYLKLSIN